LCDRLYRFIRSQLPYPDLVIRLTATRSAIEKRLSTRDRINIATSADLDQIEVFLNEWITTLPLENVIQVDVTSAPIDYLEILPSLQMQIRERLGGEFEPYETGYIP
jgi:broad-specificity NMP kinase